MSRYRHWMSRFSRRSSILLADLQAQFGLTYLFISHAIPVIEHISTRIGVMYVGKLVEVGTSQQICMNPKHPYTQALLSAVPVPDPAAKKQRIVLKGDVPTPINPPSGCRFHPRCPIAVERCKAEEPPLFAQWTTNVRLPVIWPSEN